MGLRIDCDDCGQRHFELWLWRGLGIFASIAVIALLVLA